MRSPLGAIAAVMALGMAATNEPFLLVDERPQPRRRRSTSEPRKRVAHEAQFIGDGFDQDRIEAAERKRARKAAKLAANHPSEDSTR